MAVVRNGRVLTVLILSVLVQECPPVFWEITNALAEISITTAHKFFPGGPRSNTGWADESFGPQLVNSSAVPRPAAMPGKKRSLGFFFLFFFFAQKETVFG